MFNCWAETALKAQSIHWHPIDNRVLTQERGGAHKNTRDTHDALKLAFQSGFKAVRASERKN